MSGKSTHFIKTRFFNYLMAHLEYQDRTPFQKSRECQEWLDESLLRFIDEFVVANGLLESSFVRKINRIFETSKFDLLFKKWVTEYLFKIFNFIYDACANGSIVTRPITIEDNPINRFAVKKYSEHYKIELNVKWLAQRSFFSRLVTVFFHCTTILGNALNRGIRLSLKKEYFSVMREAMWGLQDVGGRYFHDDFFVDGDKIRKKDLVLFARGTIADCDRRLSAYIDAKKAPYRSFYLPSLAIGWKPLFSRIVWKYMYKGVGELISEIRSTNFSLFSSVYIFFIVNAIPYEKVFSYFDIGAELGHNCFSANHIPEAIVCQNHGTKYYLFNWSDLAIKMDLYLVSFLACDKYLLWGKAHFQGSEGGEEIFQPIGYIFKKAIKDVRSNRQAFISEMNIAPCKKISTFFDESFGGQCQMAEDHYVTLWEAALKLAQLDKDNAVLIKPKELSRYNLLSKGLKEKFFEIKHKIENTPNMYIIDSSKWSFIECIGISDLVITQGMTSSATIAIICGIEALYLDQAMCRHKLSSLFKDKIVFDDPQRLVEMAAKVLIGEKSVFKVMPDNILREFDAYPDDNAIDRLRDVLIGGHQ